MRRLGLALLVVVASAAVLALALPAGAAKKPRERPVSAHMVLDSTTYTVPCNGPCGTGGPLTRCSYEVFLEFTPLKGASSYDIVLQDLDPRVNATYQLGGDPYRDHLHGHDAPHGRHRYGGFTGGDGPSPCYTIGDFAKRFKIRKAKAIFDGTSKINGTVYSARGDLAAGVTVRAGSQRTVTDGNGAYTLNVKDGKYTVSAGRDYCLVPQGRTCDHDKRVEVEDGIETVDFKAPSFRLAGRIVKNCGGQSIISNWRRKIPVCKNI